MFSFHAVAAMCFCDAVTSAPERNSSPASALQLFMLFGTAFRQFTSTLTCILTSVSLTNQTRFIHGQGKDFSAFPSLVRLLCLQHAVNMESLSNRGAEPSRDQSRGSSQFFMLQLSAARHFHSGKSLPQELMKLKVGYSTDVNELSFKERICKYRKET